MEKVDEYLEDDFVIWNESLGIHDFTTIGEIKQEENSIQVWMEDPYEMVGPLSLDELITQGEISFAACVVMTKEKWDNTKIKLQQKSFVKQRQIHKEFQEELNSRNRKKRAVPMNLSKEKEYRKLLSLPIEGELKISQIKIAYRKTAKATHPDTGGDHHEFVLITEAKDALLQALAKC